MSRKVTPSERMRKGFMEAVGDASLDFSDYCRLAAPAMLQTAMECEVAEFVRRQQYQRRSGEQSVYRDGYTPRDVRSGAGTVELFVPQKRAGSEPFQTAILGAYQRRSEIFDAMIPAMFVKGLSDRNMWLSPTHWNSKEDQG